MKVYEKNNSMEKCGGAEIYNFRRYFYYFNYPDALLRIIIYKSVNLIRPKNTEEG